MLCKVFSFLIGAVSFVFPFLFLCSVYTYCLHRFGFEETVVVALANLTTFFCYFYERGSK